MVLDNVFRMPGEFEKHARTWMIFPHRPDNWRDDAIHAQKAITDLAKTISEFEEVVMLVPRKFMRSAFKLLHDSKVKIVVSESDDCWARDTGATFVKDDSGKIAGISWDFNAWGGIINGLYTSWENDSKIADYMCRVAGVEIIATPGFVLEGGSIHVDGEGTCITTKECLLSEGRNPHLTHTQIEDYLKEYIGIKKVIWLDNGIVDDETNGHVDNMACFARPGEIILAWTDDETHPQYYHSKAAYDLLSDETDAKGRKFIVHKLHIPKDMYYTEEDISGLAESGLMCPRKKGERLAASYVNFIMPNGAIVFPTFGDEEYDKKAREQLESIFPDRKIIGFYSREILLGGGNLHCITQQQIV